MTAHFDKLCVDAVLYSNQTSSKVHLRESPIRLRWLFGVQMIWGVDRVRGPIYSLARFVLGHSTSNQVIGPVSLDLAILSRAAETSAISRSMSVAIR
jgi:hypothetical protein